MPLFSIIIPLYNKEKYISKTLDSVLQQDFEDYEVVICDDGSTDNSVDYINRNYQSSRIRLINKENGGPSSARNSGVAVAKGEWIVFLDADDLLLPNALSVFFKLISCHPDIFYFVCNYYIAVNGKAKLFTNFRHDGVLNNPFFYEAIRELTERPGSSVIRRELLLQYPFNEQLRRFEDAENQYNIMRSNLLYQSSTPVMISNRDAGCASFYRKNIEEDFEGHLIFDGKSFWERMSLYQLALDCKNGYPEAAENLYRFIYKRMDYKIAYFLIRGYWLTKSIYNRLFNKNKSIPVDMCI